MATLSGCTCSIAYHNGLAHPEAPRLVLGKRPVSSESIELQSKVAE